MLATTLGILGAAGVVAGAILRFQQSPAGQPQGSIALALGLGVLGTAFLLDSAREIVAVDFRHERELMLFRWMSKAAGIVLMASALFGGLAIAARRRKP